MSSSKESLAVSSFRESASGFFSEASNFMRFIIDKIKQSIEEDEEQRVKSSKRIEREFWGKPVLTVEEAALYLDVTEDEVLDLINRNALLCRKFESSGYRIDKDELPKILKANGLEAD
jgi:excisionase family DNA binding protein